MSLFRAPLSLILALSLLGCAGVPATPPAGPALARLTPEELERMLPKAEPKLPLSELVRLSKSGATAQAIIARIKHSESRYALSASQLIGLRDQGVSTEVLDYLLSANEQALRDRMVDEINQRERRHAEELQREQELRRDSYYCDPWWPGYPGSGWNFGYPIRPYGGIYWRR